MAYTYTYTQVWYSCRHTPGTIRAIFAGIRVNTASTQVVPRRLTVWSTVTWRQPQTRPVGRGDAGINACPPQPHLRRPLMAGVRHVWSALK